MIAEFKITDEDLIAQQRDALKNTKYHKKTRMIQFVASILLVSCMYWLIEPATSTIILSVCVFIALTPLAFKVYGYANIIRFKKDVLTHLKNKIGLTTLRLTEDELIKESQHLTETFQWDELVKFTEDEKRYFLYLSDLNAITIKKEPYNMNEKEIMEYQAFIKTKANN